MTWYRIEPIVMAAGDAPRRVKAYIHDYIGLGGVTALDMIRDLTAAEPDEVELHIHSYGGELDEGVALYNTLRDMDVKLTTVVDGLAASAATLPFVAGTERRVPRGARLMVHEPWLRAQGNAAELEKQAARLRKSTTGLSAVYQQATGLAADEVSDLIREDTWLDSMEAISLGFATIETDDTPVPVKNEWLRELPPVPEGLIVSTPESEKSDEQLVIVREADPAPEDEREPDERDAEINDLHAKLEQAEQRERERLVADAREDIDALVHDGKIRPAGAKAWRDLRVKDPDTFAALLVGLPDRESLVGKVSDWHDSDPASEVDAETHDEREARRYQEFRRRLDAARAHGQVKTVDDIQRIREQLDEELPSIPRGE